MGLVWPSELEIGLTVVSIRCSESKALSYSQALPNLSPALAEDYSKKLRFINVNHR